MESTREMKVSGKKYNMFFVVDEEDYKKFELWKYKWYPKIRRNIIYIRANKRGEKGKQILLHKLILGLLDSSKNIEIDHIDHNGLNNSKTNLRITDHGGNQRNTLKHKKTSSRFKGVCWHKGMKRKKRWVASIFDTLAGKKKCLGYYKTEKEAAEAYNKAATELFGTMACLNDLPQGECD